MIASFIWEVNSGLQKSQSHGHTFNILSYNATVLKLRKAISCLRINRFSFRRCHSFCCDHHNIFSLNLGEGHRPKYRRSRLTSWRVHDSLVLFPREKFVLWYTRVYPDYKSIPDVVTYVTLFKLLNSFTLLTFLWIYWRYSVKQNRSTSVFCSVTTLTQLSSRANCSTAKNDHKP